MLFSLAHESEGIKVADVCCAHAAKAITRTINAKAFNLGFCGVCWCLEFTRLKITCWTIFGILLFFIAKQLQYTVENNNVSTDFCSVSASGFAS